MNTAIETNTKMKIITVVIGVSLALVIGITSAITYFVGRAHGRAAMKREIGAFAFFTDLVGGWGAESQTLVPIKSTPAKDLKPPTFLRLDEWHTVGDISLVGSKPRIVGKYLHFDLLVRNNHDRKQFYFSPELDIVDDVDNQLPARIATPEGDFSFYGKNVDPKQEEPFVVILNKPLPKTQYLLLTLKMSNGKLPAIKIPAEKIRGFNILTEGNEHAKNATAR